MCELVGLYLLNEIRSKIGPADIGLYRDDGLAIFPNLSGPKAEKIKKELVEVFKSNGLSITIDTNLKIVDFLDVTFNLIKKTYYPFNKPNNKPLYINRNSNHPPQVIKQLPEMINRRICEISCNEDEFYKAKHTYQSALENSDFSYNMEYKSYQPSSRKRKRNITYFNPPFSSNVKTNVGKEFLKLVRKHFTPEHKLHSLFNRMNLKLSYSCMPNIGNIIKSHNSKILNENQIPSKLCNCRKSNECPMEGNCLVPCVVYKAEVKSSNIRKIYYGSCNGTFKERFRNHKTSFSLASHKDDTKLSQYIWNLKNQNKQFEVAWSIVKKCSPYRPSSNKCDLCLSEKVVIIQHKEDDLLNTRSEIANKCRHTNKYSLSKILAKRIQF